MRILFEVKVPDEKLENSGYSIDEFADLTKRIIKGYWYDEGIVLNVPEDEKKTEEELGGCVINIYK